jgi:hypothetical protein
LISLTSDSAPHIHRSQLNGSEPAIREHPQMAGKKRPADIFDGQVDATEQPFERR